MLPKPSASACEHAAQTLLDFIMARSYVERRSTFERWNLAKTAFRQTYGQSAWRHWFDDTVRDRDLGDFIFDHEALRDS